jgi:crotonobetainyl-CoA:carnitine CoA-transferase CaiB-like acyl-CoA transferase
MTKKNGVTPSEARRDASKPLSGIVVIELGHSVAAPFAAQILADLGARVIKIEKPETGDDARVWGPPFWYGAAATFQGLNRNKLSATVDLKNETQCGQLADFIAKEVDVVVQNMRPGLVAKIGLDGDALRKRNSKLIYCNLGAFGDVGPLRNSTGYDPLVQAFSGIMSVTGEEGRPPVRVGPSIIDMGAGMWCAIGILAAINHRTHTGEGCTVDNSLFETALSWMTIPFANTIASGRSPGRTGSETPMLVPYKAFHASDRYIVIAAGNDNLFRKLCSVLEQDAWADDERFNTNAHRVHNRDILNKLIQKTISTASASSWIAKLDAVGVPCALMQTVDEVLKHPQTDALGMIVQPEGSGLQLIGLPLRFDGTRPAVTSAPPALGAHSSILSESPRAAPVSENKIVGTG